MISRDDVKLVLKKSMGFTNNHHSLFRDEELGIQCEVITNKNKWGGFAKPRSFYFIDNIEKEFTELDDLIEFYNEKFAFEGENPDMEVKYVKVIVKRNQ